MDASATASNTPRILDREPLVLNHRSYSWITNRICGIVEKGSRFDPDKIAEVYFELHGQAQGSFEAERVLR